MLIILRIMLKVIVKICDFNVRLEFSWSRYGKERCYIEEKFRVSIG